jgi:hypothetical protein
VTAAIHRLPSTGREATARLRDAARALSRMPSAVASAIDVVGVDLPVVPLARIVEHVAAEFDLIATIEAEPVVIVRFERR